MTEESIPSATPPLAEEIIALRKRYETAIKPLTDEELKLFPWTWLRAELQEIFARIMAARAKVR